MVPVKNIKLSTFMRRLDLWSRRVLARLAWNLHVLELEAQRGAWEQGVVGEHTHVEWDRGAWKVKARFKFLQPSRSYK